MNCLMTVRPAERRLASSPWYKVVADDQRRARLNCIAHMLSLIPYEPMPQPDHDLGKRAKPKGAPAEPLFAHVVPDRF